jgi:hypothetical protein
LAGIGFRYRRDCHHDRAIVGHCGLLATTIDRGTAMTKFNDTILALDLATVSGFAWGKPDTVPTFGQQRFAKQGEPRPVTYRKMRLWLQLFCSAHDIKLIIYESPALPMTMQGRTNANTIKLLMGMAEHLEEWCYDQIELREASVAQVRTHFLGQNFKRDIARPMTIERCRQRGWLVETSDAADACALWDYMVCCKRPDLAVAGTPLFQTR